MSEFKSSNFTNEDNSGGPDLVGVTTFTSPYYFVPPSGTTAERPSGDGLAPGMLRFNTDIGRLEVWRGDHWATILGESPSLNGGARGVFGGGSSGPAIGNINIIQYITISTTGNAIDFGDLLSARNWLGACSSSTRGLFAGGSPGGINTIEYITISSTGDSLDFGDLLVTRFQYTALSNQTRGLFAGEYGTNSIEYVTIASLGNAQDFGDLIDADNRYGMSCSSLTRGIIVGGGVPYTNTINYVTISTTGNSQDFGDMTQPRTEIGAGLSNSTRGLFGGGQIGTASPLTTTNSIDFITIATLGNAQDFGDLTSARFQMFGSGASSSTRGVFGGGNSSNIIEYVTILTTGNAIDFGDLIFTPNGGDACSNAHGGL